MDEEKLKAMGARIRAAREALGLKHSDIARELGVSEVHVRHFETG